MGLFKKKRDPPASAQVLNNGQQHPWPVSGSQGQPALPHRPLVASPSANPGWNASAPVMPSQNVPGWGLQSLGMQSVASLPPGPGAQHVSPGAVNWTPNHTDNWAAGPDVVPRASTSPANLATGQQFQAGADLQELVASKFDFVISCIDDEAFSGDERELAVHAYTQAGEPAVLDRSLSANAAAVLSTTNHFSKTWLYANSRLPPHLPPLKLYMPTYPLICLAAKYAERVYTKVAGPERSSYINADFRRGTKAMVLKSVPIDDMNTIVFAIRGSQSIMDWCVNYRTEPTSPEGFLDDGGNHCHAGFLGVARKTAPLIAERLRTLMQEDPGRCGASLLICGHSAGGAVAQLLYAHMLSQAAGVASELKHLTGFFKRVHCVTFGAPPVSLLPLQKPACRHARKSLFFAFANEGDPVVRADKAVVASLLKLYAAPAPASVSKGALPLWKVPPGALSLGGTIVLLRERQGARDADDVEAFKVSDERLRTVVFGDPVKHMMKLYKRRVELLATRAVTVHGFG